MTAWEIGTIGPSASPSRKRAPNRIGKPVAKPPSAENREKAIVQAIMIALRRPVASASRPSATALIAIASDSAPPIRPSWVLVR